MDRRPDFLNLGAAPVEWTFGEGHDRTGAIEVPGEPDVDVTGDQTRAEGSGDKLREIQAKLEAARAEAASLRVLLALRTHQHDATWRQARRLAAEREDARAGLTEAAARDAAGARAAIDEAVATADERAEAVRTVLTAVLASIGSRALDRRRFQDLIARAGRDTPDHGPGAARHAVLLTEARRVLGIPT